VPAISTQDDFLAAAFAALPGGWTGARGLLDAPQPRASNALPETEPRAFDTEAEALEHLSRAHDELSERVAALERQARGSLADLVDRLQGYEQQMRTLGAQRRALAAEVQSCCNTTSPRTRRELDSLETTMRIQQVNTAVLAAQSAAYGVRGSIRETDNMLLIANHVFWTFLEPVLRRLGFDLGPSPSFVTWLAPVGSLVTGGMLLSDRQHVRFITGITTFDGTNRFIVESLRSRIAPGFRREFERRTNVPVTVTPIDLTPLGNLRLRAEVLGGFLLIEAFVPDSGVPKGRVAWMVDTGVDGG